MMGLLIVLAGCLVFAHRYLSADSLRRIPRRLLAGSVIWVLLLWGYVALIPAIEVRTLAEPVNVEYLDGKLSLVGYRLPEEPVQPGEEIIVTYYWRTNGFISQNYNLSSRLLFKPTGDLLTQHDLLWSGPPPVVAWMPGTTIRVRNRIMLPDDMPAIGSYWLMTRMWSGPADASVGLPVTATDEWLITPDGVVISETTVILDQFTVLNEAQQPYTFANGLTLAGQHVGALTGGDIEDRQLPLQFWWEASQAQETDTIQLLHLYQGDDYLIFDDEPFQGRFPTTDWPQGLTLEDSWAITLPEDISGEWQIIMGLYDPVTYERVAVTDADGNPQADHLIQIGTVTIE
ncbi:hypothetical protein ACFLYO_11325 [Chloroflexota bacterium]